MTGWLIGEVRELIGRAFRTGACRRAAGSCARAGFLHRSREPACSGPDRPTHCRRIYRRRQQTETSEPQRRSRRTRWSTAASPGPAAARASLCRTTSGWPREPHQKTSDFAPASGCVPVDRIKSLVVRCASAVTRAVAVSLLRVAPKRTTESNGAGVVTHMCGNPAMPRPRGFSSHAALTPPYDGGYDCTWLGGVREEVKVLADPTPGAGHAVASAPRGSAGPAGPGPPSVRTHKRPARQPDSRSWPNSRRHLRAPADDRRHRGRHRPLQPRDRRTCGRAGGAVRGAGREPFRRVRQRPVPRPRPRETTDPRHRRRTLPGQRSTSAGTSSARRVVSSAQIPQAMDHPPRSPGTVRV